MIRAGIIGGAGYTGGETIRILLNHPNVELAFVQSRSQSGKYLHETHSDLVGETELKFSAEVDNNVDVIFLCLGHGESKKLLGEKSFPSSVKLIDLGNDFRLGDKAPGREFVYGLPELQREKIKTASNVANPGCFATTIQLGLLPLAKAGKLKEVYATGITGSTGAGQKLQDTTHFTWRANNISAYKTLTHQHMGEINQTLTALQPGAINMVNFVPWRGDFTRGIFVSSVVTVPDSLSDLNKMYKEFYKGHPFTHVADSMIDLKQVVNTNKCLVFLEKEGDKLVIHTALDNLLKGASGQAVQNMNLIFGFNEDAGLRLKSTVF
ncbi:MAG TPA: N-acetyl-gamma-glutamyl-phosphate reductase [Cyclobacteriaceae bacterium]|nr:N-acetyl-gamma-glutamyl-phosphate reductase [Cyclobacteriaceae bacterium]